MRLEPTKEKNRNVLSCQRVELLFGKDCVLGVVFVGIDDVQDPVVRLLIFI